jgi:hypothetical protein
MKLNLAAFAALVGLLVPSAPHLLAYVLMVVTPIED